jgi:hypothetical protein
VCGRRCRQRRRRRRLLRLREDAAGAMWQGLEGMLDSLSTGSDPNSEWYKNFCETIPEHFRFSFSTSFLLKESDLLQSCHQQFL